jgi:Zn-dependent M28 family amino/carboxypeptidase
MKRLAALLLACTAGPALAQDAPRIDPAAVRAHVAFLADDLLEGRDAGTRGYDIAARYVASHFEALGLKPGTPGGWYQPITLQNAQADPAKPGALTIGGKMFAHGELAFVSPDGRSPNQSFSAPAVFVGHGIVAPEAGIDDYAGLDVRGKIVVFLAGTPTGLPSERAAQLDSTKNVVAQDRGAVGLITLATPEFLKRFPLAMIRREISRPTVRLIEPDGSPRYAAPGIKAQAYAVEAAADALFAGAPKSFAQVLADAAKPGAKLKGFVLAAPVTIAQTTLVTTTRSPNVIGVLPGSDPALAREYVLLTAHLDHNGVNPNAPGEDKIFNGAMDNAAGVATMLEAARAFVGSGRRPKRSVMFVALTAEEDGLRGSDYLARHPVVPAGARVVANVNLDMPVLTYPLSDVVAFGAEHSTIGETVNRAAKASGLTLSPDPMPEENVFTRSDHYSFVKQGVPAVMLATGVKNGGGEAFKAFLATHYHKPSDQLSLPFNWDAAAKFAEVNYRIARDLADAAEAPRWYEGNVFGEQFAKGQPKAAKPVAK